MSTQRPSAALRRGRSSTTVAEMLESIVGCKWSMRILGLLAAGRCRPSAILRACPGLSAKVMHERLRKLERFGIVARVVFGDRPPVQVEYPLTPFGRRFLGVVEAVGALQRELEDGAAG